MVTTMKNTHQPGGRKFRIKWTNTLRAGKGQSVPMDKSEAERIAAELNVDYPGIIHTVVPA